MYTTYAYTYIYTYTYIDCCRRQEYLPLLPTIGVFVVFAAGMTVILARYNKWNW